MSGAYIQVFSYILESDTWPAKDFDGGGVFFQKKKKSILTNTRVKEKKNV
jgi:hypothetical protein